MIQRVFVWGNICRSFFVGWICTHTAYRNRAQKWGHWYLNAENRIKHIPFIHQHHHNTHRNNPTQHLISFPHPAVLHIHYLILVPSYIFYSHYTSSFIGLCVYIFICIKTNMITNGKYAEREKRGGGGETGINDYVYTQSSPWRASPSNIPGSASRDTIFFFVLPVPTNI